MEWLFIVVSIGSAVGYAVVLGRGIEQRKRWALEIARAIGTLDYGSGERFMRDIPSLPPESEPDTEEANATAQFAA